MVLHRRLFRGGHHEACGEVGKRGVQAEGRRQHHGLAVVVEAIGGAAAVVAYGEEQTAVGRGNGFLGGVGGEEGARGQQQKEDFFHVCIISYGFRCYAK